ncbi:DUF4870 domain-containing protein [Pontibacillus litoralis]|uniref:DUF4870 domain-containing protein n=1 Tax=Pontibacillus litoralis JSM 072002 TaxID=1385512 RepID=A0A0A5HNA6_9BACI|nr:DUF4870 domain-containing protein [Pontibacillus litoralis]KGX85112.1 hypothetical protein N784_10015 [Pontibacillus litoralis JSM 072002]
MPSSDERMLAMLIYVVSLFTAIIGPLIIWILKKDDSEFIDYHGKEYFNFFLSYAIYGVISSILVIVLIGFVFLFIIWIVGIIFTIMAAVKAYNGEKYKIPTVIHFIK